MNEKEATQKLFELRKMSEKHGVSDLANYVLNNSKFQYWSASSLPHQHHHGDYGLVYHTHEVVMTCFKMAELYPQYKINERELFLSALFHDFGKTEDYERTEEKNIVKGNTTTCIYPKWQGTLHKRRIHHISESLMAWDRAWHSIYDEDGPLRENVAHAILAHHGRREWGSPVAPNTRVAWLLHLCDGISARLNDCETLDRLD